jgi:hypothetical protein
MLFSHAEIQSPQPSHNDLNVLLLLDQGGWIESCDEGDGWVDGSSWTQDCPVSCSASHLRRYSKHLLARKEVKFIHAYIMTII